MKKRVCYCVFLALYLTACGQKGALVRPAEDTEANLTPATNSTASTATTETETESKVATKLPEETKEQ